MTIRTAQPEITTYRFTVEKYHEMIDAGVLGPEDNLELIEGELVKMAAVGTGHIACVNRLNYFLTKHLNDRAIISVQNPVRLSIHSEPEPDIALLHFRSDFYVNELAQKDDIYLLIEVAQTSRHYDQRVKVPLYAKANIPEVWLVDLDREHVEVYRRPNPEAEQYEQLITYRRGETISPAAFDDVQITITDILG